MLFAPGGREGRVGGKEGLPDAFALVWRFLWGGTGWAGGIVGGVLTPGVGRVEWLPVGDGALSSSFGVGGGEGGVGPI